MSLFSSFLYLRRHNKCFLMGIYSFDENFQSLKHSAWQCLENYELPWNCYFSNLHPKFMMNKILHPGLKENLFLMIADCQVVVGWW